MHVSIVLPGNRLVIGTLLVDDRWPGAQHVDRICSVHVDSEIFVRGPELFIFDSNRWLVYHDESSLVFSALPEMKVRQVKTQHLYNSMGPRDSKSSLVPESFPARPPTCFKAFLAWMFSLPKFPDPSTWPWWLSIWLWWLEDRVHPELKGSVGKQI